MSNANQTAVTGSGLRSALLSLGAWCARLWAGARERLPRYVALTRLNKPIGAMLLLWPTLWALWIAAAGMPSPHLLTVFVLGVFLTRSAGCVLNDIADRGFDPHVERTRTRPLAAGDVSLDEALMLAGVLLCMAFLLVLTTNHLAVLLAFASLPLIAIYPYMKRCTYIPQFFLGLAFSWGIPMAFAAVTNTVPKIAWLLLTGNVLWAVIYDTIYAMVDRDDDLKVGVKSTAILFDDADRTIIGIMQVMLILVFVIAGYNLRFGFYYYAGVISAVALMVYHQFLIRNRQREQCFKAFLNNTWVGLVIFLGILLEYTF